VLPKLGENRMVCLRNLQVTKSQRRRTLASEAVDEGPGQARARSRGMASPSWLWGRPEWRPWLEAGGLLIMLLAGDVCCMVLICL
jgi:hypothetical protein